MPVKKTTKKIDDKEIIRNIFLKTNISLIDYTDGLTEEEYKVFVSDCSLIYSTPAFKFIRDGLISRFMLNSVVSDDMLMLARGQGTVNGIDLFFDELEKYHKIYVEEHKQDEQFNTQDIY